jgi:hypothetical protein
VSHQNRALDPNGLHDREDIVSQTICRVVPVRRWRLARRSKAPAGDAVDMVLADKLRSETIERVSGVSIALQEDQRSAGSSPIQNLKLNTGRDGDELRLVW